MGRRVLAHSLLLLVLVTVSSRSLLRPWRKLIVESEAAQRHARLRRCEDRARPSRPAQHAWRRLQTRQRVAIRIRSGQCRGEPRCGLVIFGGRRRLGLVSSQSTVLLDHLRKLHLMLLYLGLEATTRLLLVLLHFGGKETLRLHNPLELQALFFYLLRRQRKSTLTISSKKIWVLRTRARSGPLRIGALATCWVCFGVITHQLQCVQRLVTNKSARVQPRIATITTRRTKAKYAVRWS